MIDRWSKARAGFEREVRSLAADLLEAGRGDPDECLKAAETLVIQRRSSRAETREKLTVIT